MNNTQPLTDLPDPYPNYKEGDTATTRFSIDIPKEDELTIRAITLNPSYKHLIAKNIIHHIANECRRQKWAYPNGAAELTAYVLSICGDDVPRPTESGPSDPRPVDDERSAVGGVRAARSSKTNKSAASERK